MPVGQLAGPCERLHPLRLHVGLDKIEREGLRECILWRMLTVGNQVHNPKGNLYSGGAPVSRTFLIDVSKHVRQLRNSEHLAGKQLAGLLLSNPLGGLYW